MEESAEESEEEDEEEKYRKMVCLIFSPFFKEYNSLESPIFLLKFKVYIIDFYLVKESLIFEIWNVL